MCVCVCVYVCVLITKLVYVHAVNTYFYLFKRPYFVDLFSFNTHKYVY